MTLEILDAAVPSQRARWLSLWNSWPGREVHAHPTYGELFANEGIDRCMALAWSKDDSTILFPIILRPLSKEPWTSESNPGWDFTTPYGYGGAYKWGDGGITGAKFLELVKTWARSEHIVTGFLRLSLFESQLLALPGERKTKMSNVVRTLELDDDSLWSDYAHKVRKNVKRARKHDLQVEFDEVGSGLKEFLEIYTSTMDRRRAESSFLFGQTFFDRIIEELSGCYVFVHVRTPDDRMVSTELVLLSALNGYSFLGGTREDSFAMRPNDLLKHETIRWLRDSGRKTFVLGGGYGKDDGIYQYKKSFAPNGDQTFFTQSLVFDPEVLEILMEKRCSWEAEQGDSWIPDLEFFPPYRS